MTFQPVWSGGSGDLDDLIFEGEENAFATELRIHLIGNRFHKVFAFLKAFSFKVPNDVAGTCFLDSSIDVHQVVEAFIAFG